MNFGMLLQSSTKFMIRYNHTMHNLTPDEISFVLEMQRRIANSLHLTLLDCGYDGDLLIKLRQMLRKPYGSGIIQE